MVRLHEWKPVQNQRFRKKKNLSFFPYNLWRKLINRIGRSAAAATAPAIIRIRIKRISKKPKCLCDCASVNWIAEIFHNIQQFSGKEIISIFTGNSFYLQRCGKLLRFHLPHLSQNFTSISFFFFSLSLHCIIEQLILITNFWNLNTI